MAHKYVYFFGEGTAEGRAEMKELLGGKGANLAEMSSLAIPVPAGFTISTEVCSYFYDKESYPPEMEGQVSEALARVEKVMGARFGDHDNPLLLSVRSGARASMPGMMDTVLNLGLNDVTVEGLIARSGNARFAYDSYRRFVAMFGDVVLGLKPEGKDDIDPFDEILEEKKKARGVHDDTELTADDLKELVEGFKGAIRKKTGRDFPEDPEEQLWRSIGAVFGWMNQRAIVYRKLNNIPADGDGRQHSGDGVRQHGRGLRHGRGLHPNPATGEEVFYGEYLMNAQGEDVVAGTRTPLPINRLQKSDPDALSLEETSPRSTSSLRPSGKLGRHYRDMQDIEFTIQQRKLWMLQTRAGKRTGFASFR